MKNRHHFLLSLPVVLCLAAALFSCRKGTDVTEPHQPVTKTDYVHLVLNGKGQEEIVFCELVPQASVTIRSSAPWLKLSDSGEIIDLETQGLGGPFQYGSTDVVGGLKPFANFAAGTE